MDYVDVLYVEMSSKAATPTRATKHSVGLDLYSPSDYKMSPCSHLQIPTQIKIKIPVGHYGRLASKSSLSMVHQVHVGAGVIDPDYTGEVKVLLINAAPCYHYIKRGDPIAQLILEKVSLPILRKVGSVTTHSKGSAWLWLLKCKYFS